MGPLVSWVKRAVDLVGAGALALCFAPLAPALALAIRLDSRGPIFYRQRRAGRLRGVDPDGPRFEVFDMYKLRTMRLDAERDTGPVLAAEDDPRVTRVGRVLRRTRLDELPQLWNVLRGEMSLVGPRPERPELLRDLVLAIPFFEERMRDVRPGLTGLAQVNLTYAGHAPDGSAVARFRDSLTNPYHVDGAEGADADGMRLKLLYDVAYAAALESLPRYLATEIAVLARTPWVMVRGLGR